MNISSNNDTVQNMIPIAQACAITFQGNASNNLQQDAFFFLDNWYQEDLGVMAVTPVELPFCLAVSDGVASSNHSQYCSKVVDLSLNDLTEKPICPHTQSQAIQSRHVYLLYINVCLGVKLMLCH